MIPTALLLIVIVAIMSERGECGSSSTTSLGDNNNNNSSNNLSIQCYREPRTFVNAFTSTCICNAIRVVLDADADEEN